LDYAPDIVVKVMQAQSPYDVGQAAFEQHHVSWLLKHPGVSICGTSTWVVYGSPDQVLGPDAGSCFEESRKKALLIIQEMRFIPGSDLQAISRLVRALR
jgi:hypothetical protein